MIKLFSNINLIMIKNSVLRVIGIDALIIAPEVIQITLLTFVVV